MSNRKLLILAVVAVVMVVWAVVQSRFAGERPSVQVGEIHLIQGLNTDAIASIMLKKDDKTQNFQYVKK